ncbi:MAG: MFS transporter [Halobacteriales archaeon]
MTTATPNGDNESAAGGWWTVGLITGWQTTASIGFYTVFAASALIRETFGVSRALVGITVSVLMGGYLLFLLPVGAAVDGYGERPALIGGLVVIAIALLGIVAVPGYWWLLGAVFLLGGAYATASPATNRAIVGRVAAGRQNLALGIKQVGVTAGSAISALLITGVAARTGVWDTGFLVAAGLAVAVTAIVAVAYRGTGGGGVRWPDLRVLASNRRYVALLSAGVLLGGAFFTTTGYMVVYVAETVPTTVAFAGIVLAIAQGTGSVGRIVAGAVIDRLGTTQAVAAARVLTAQAIVAAAMLVAITAVDSAMTALVGFAGLGVVLLGFTGVYYSCLSGLVAEDRIGEATAGGQLSLNAGAIVAPPVFGTVADRVGYTLGWMGLAAGCLGAAAITWWITRRQGGP